MTAVVGAITIDAAARFASLRVRLEWRVFYAAHLGCGPVPGDSAVMR